MEYIIYNIIAWVDHDYSPIQTISKPIHLSVHKTYPQSVLFIDN